MTQPPSQQSPFASPEPGPTPVHPTPQPGQPAMPSYIPPTVAAAVANPKARTGASAGTMAFVAAIVVAAAGLGFAGGRLTAPAAATGRGNFAGNFGGNFGGANGSFNPNASGNPGRGGFGLGGGSIAVTGQVTAVANGSITVQTTSGQSVTLQVPSTVTYHTQAAGAASDVTVGSNVELSVGRGARAEASGQPAPSGQPAGNLGLSVTDITVLSK